MVMLLDSSNRLKAADVKNGQTVKILTEGQWLKDQYKDQEPTNAFVVSVNYGGETKDLKLTKASRDNLKEAWGNETSKWIGKSAMISLVSTTKGKSIMLQPVVSAEEVWGEK